MKKFIFFVAMVCSGVLSAQSTQVRVTDLITGNVTVVNVCTTNGTTWLNTIGSTKPEPFKIQSIRVDGSLPYSIRSPYAPRTPQAPQAPQVRSNTGIYLIDNTPQLMPNVFQSMPSVPAYPNVTVYPNGSFRF